MSGSEKWRIDREYRSAETSPTLQMFFLPCFCSFLVYQSDLGYLWQHQISPFLKNRPNKTLRFNEFFASQSKSFSLLTPFSPSTRCLVLLYSVINIVLGAFQTSHPWRYHYLLFNFQMAWEVIQNRMIKSSHIDGSISNKR